MSEVFKEEQDFFNLLIEETYEGPGKIISHLNCYATTTNLAQQLLREQIAMLGGQYQKNLKCFRFNGPVGAIDFPQNWGPFSRALFYFDNDEKSFYGVYEKQNDPFAFCKLLGFEKVIFFAQNEKIYLAGFMERDLAFYERFIKLFSPKEIKIAA